MVCGGRISWQANRAALAAALSLKSCAHPLPFEPYWLFVSLLGMSVLSILGSSAAVCNHLKLPLSRKEGSTASPCASKQYSSQSM